MSSGGDGGRPKSNITDPKKNRIQHPFHSNFHQYAKYDGKFRPRNHDTMESLSKMGPSELQMGIGGLDTNNEYALRVDGGWHDSTKRTDGKIGEPDHLNVKYGGKEWHVERDGSHSVYEDGKLQQYPGEDLYAYEQTHIKRKNAAGEIFYTRNGDAA
jgi:hypothetical protein